MSSQLYAQLNTTIDFTNPGVYAYAVPADARQLRLEIAGGAGGAGGWDDAIGGAGAGGSIVTATIQVQGGETIAVHVAEGGEGSLGTPKTAYGIGAAGGGDGTKQSVGALTASIAGAGGKGGNRGTGGSSPGGAGGGGASAVFIGGAAVIAGGGGGGGSNSRIAINGNWSIPGDDAQNPMDFNPEDSNCSALANGSAGEAGDDTTSVSVDGAGGSGGGGGYLNHAGAGGAGGKDGRSGQNAAPGLSGGSCTLSAARYSISNAAISLGEPTSPIGGRTVAKPDGANGYVRITPLAAATPSAATPVPSMGIWSLMGLASAIAAAGIAMTRRRSS